MLFRRRSGIGRSVVAVIVVIVVIGVAAVAVLSRGSSSTSSPSLSTSVAVSPSVSSSTASAGSGLVVTGMYTDMENDGYQPPSSNSTYLPNNATTFTGTTNDIFTVTLNLEYSGCKGSSCPDSVSQISIYPTTFTVEEVEGGLGPPVTANPLSTSSENFVFGVSIEGPPTAYDGNFTITVEMG